MDIYEDLSDDSSVTSDTLSGYETPVSPMLRSLARLDWVYAIASFCTALRHGDIETCLEVGLLTPWFLFEDPIGFSNSVSLARINRRRPAATPIHEIIAHEQQFPIRWILNVPALMDRFATVGTTNMRLPSSGYVHCRMYPGLPTVDPLFFAAHKGRAPAVLDWYNSHATDGLTIQHRPLLWWLVRHEDPVNMQVLRNILPRNHINWGTWAWRRVDRPGELSSHFDFTVLDLALIRQRDEVVEVLREHGAKTSLEVFTSARLLKLYRPGFLEEDRTPAPKEALRKRRSSFGFAEETLAAADAGFRGPCRGNLDPDLESHIFWEGKPHGPLPRRHPYFNRASTKNASR